MILAGLTVPGGSAGGLVGLTIDLLNTWGQELGGLGIGLVNLVDCIIPVLPSELILPLTGMLAGQGHIALPLAVLWPTIGSILDCLLMYYIGALFGRERTRRIVTRFPMVKTADVDRAERWFAQHGTAAVLVGRMVPGIRALITVPAGIERMAMTTFFIASTVGSFLWNLGFVFAGYFFGVNWGSVERYAGIVQTVVLVGLAILVCLFIGRRFVRRRRARAAAFAGAVHAESVEAVSSDEALELRGGSHVDAAFAARDGDASAQQDGS